MRQVKRKIDNKTTKRCRSKFLITILILFSATIAQSQKIETEELEVCIRKQIIDFLIKDNRLTGVDKNNLNSVHISELVNKKVLGYSKYGIYYITDYATNFQNLILLKKDKMIKIIVVSDSKQLMNEISSFLSETAFTDYESIEYFKAAIELLERNMTRIKSSNNVNSIWIDCN